MPSRGQELSTLILVSSCSLSPLSLQRGLCSSIVCYIPHVHSRTATRQNRAFSIVGPSSSNRLRSDVNSLPQDLSCSFYHYSRLSSLTGPGSEVPLNINSIFRLRLYFCLVDEILIYACQVFVSYRISQFIKRCSQLRPLSSAPSVKTPRVEISFEKGYGC